MIAATDKAAGHKGLSAFVVPADTPGYKVAKEEHKLGIRASSTAELVFDGCRIPKENLLGKPGDGFKICMWQLNNTRLGCAAGALGCAGSLLDLGITYANERTQFGQPIGSSSLIQASIAELTAEHHAAPLLVYRAAYLKDKGLPNQLETSVAKYYAAEAAVHAANERRSCPRPSARSGIRPSLPRAAATNMTPRWTMTGESIT